MSPVLRDHYRGLIVDLRVDGWLLLLSLLLLSRPFYPFEIVSEWPLLLLYLLLLLCVLLKFQKVCFFVNSLIVTSR
jgi:hypothetical protein